MNIIKNQILLKNFVKKRNFIENNFVRLNTISFDLRNSSFVLGKKNNVFFFKKDKLHLFLNEIFHFYLNFFSKESKTLLFSDKKLNFLLSKEAYLRCFQTIFFGKYSGGIFTNAADKNKNYKKLFKKIDTFNFTFLSSKDPIFLYKESALLKKPTVIFAEGEKNPKNYIFYKTLFQNNSYFSNYFFFKLLSDLLIKIQMYHYIESKTVH
jgi:hypothetical protein